MAAKARELAERQAKPPPKMSEKSEFTNLRHYSYIQIFFSAKISIIPASNPRGIAFSTSSSLLIFSFQSRSQLENGAEEVLKTPMIVWKVF